ncbi:MAG: serine hydrolase [Chitinophagaceae bacterium]
MRTRILLFIFLLAGPAARAQNRVQQIDSLLTALHAAGKFNGNVLVAEKGEVIYSHSFGLANETTKAKLDENSVFELASCSKQFTAMGILLLAQSGKLKLDDPVTKYIPELSYYPDITIRHLLHHTSGLPDYMDLMDSVYDKSRIATNKDMIAVFQQHEPETSFAADTRYEYSNTGYALLASVIEKASGMSYGEYLQTAIFRPLQMNHTFVYTRRLAPKEVPNYAFGYVYDDKLKAYKLPDDVKETRMVVWLDGIVGDGTVNSTVTDLLKWDRALYTTQLLPAEAMKEVFAPAVLNDGSRTRYGFGWSVDSTADFGRVASHSGGWPGYVTWIERHLDNDKTIIILQNHANVTIPARSLRYILYNKPVPGAPQVRKEITLTPEQQQAVTGVYEIQPGVELAISLDKGQVYAQLTGQNAFPIFAESELFFFLKVVDAQLQFEKNAAGQVTQLYLLQNGNRLPAKRK